MLLKKTIQKLMLTICVLSFILLFGCNTSQNSTESSTDQNYPDDPITVVIPYSAGGGSDMITRTLGEFSKEEFGDNFNYVYKEGAGGALGASDIAKAESDGYTMGTTNFPHVVLQHLEGAGDFDPLEDFDYLGQVASYTNILTTLKGSEYSDLESFINAAKENPGQITLGVPGALSDSHIAAFMLMETADIDFTIIPFSGGADLLAAILGEHVDACFCTVEIAKPEEEKLNFLALTSAERHRLIPDVPTFVESGYDIVSFGGRLFVVPAGLEPEKLERLREGIKNIWDKEEFQENMEKGNFYTEWMSGEEVEELIRDYKITAAELLEKYNN